MTTTGGLRVALRGSERATGEQRALPYTGRRRTQTPTAPASPAPGDHGLRQAGWMGDYYRRRQLAARIPAKAGTESEYPHLRRPAAGAMASGWADALVIPRLAAGVELLGEYQGSGLTKATFLARSPSGQVVHLSRLLYLVLSEIDGHRTVGEIAGRVSVTFGRTVSAGNVDYLLANKLTPLGLVASEAAADRRDPMLLTLKLRRTLIPAAGVQHIARLFAPLFAPPVVVVLLGLLAAADVWLVRSGQILPAFADTLDHPPLLLVVLGLSVVSILFHECGHAAACRYGGARPGRIGLGVYVLWPAAFTNVTDSYRLGRAGRIRVDLGGVYFTRFALVLAGTYRATGYAPLPAAVLLVHVELMQQLLPSLQCDGYFIMTDLIGVPDMFQRVGPVLASLIPGPGRTHRRGVPVSAHGFDALSSPGADPSDENDDQAGYAIDGDPATAWSTQHYLASPFFGGLKSGTGLILDMGRRVRLRSVTVTFGVTTGADVAIEIGNDDTLAAATLSTFTTVATADDVAGRTPLPPIARPLAATCSSGSPNSRPKATPDSTRRSTASSSAAATRAGRGIGHRPQATRPAGTNSANKRRAGSTPPGRGGRRGGSGGREEDLGCERAARAAEALARLALVSPDQRGLGLGRLGPPRLDQVMAVDEGLGGRIAAVTGEVAVVSDRGPATLRGGADQDPVHVTAHAQRGKHQVDPRTCHPVDNLAHFAQHAGVGGDDATGGSVRAVERIDVRQPGPVQVGRAAAEQRFGQPGVQARDTEGFQRGPVLVPAALEDRIGVTPARLTQVPPRRPRIRRLA